MVEFLYNRKIENILWFLEFEKNSIFFTYCNIVYVKNKKSLKYRKIRIGQQNPSTIINHNY